MAATGEIIGRVNIPSKLALYTGLETNTSKVNIDNGDKTISVDVKRVPLSLEFILNSFNEEEISYDGSEGFGIDLSPLIIINDEETFYNAHTKKLFRRATGDNLIEAPFFVTRETKEPTEASVDITLAGLSNNSTVPDSKFLTCFDNDLSSFINSVGGYSNIYANLYKNEEEEIIVNALRLGSNNNTGSVTLNLNFTVNSIVIGASKYAGQSGTAIGTYDATAELWINNIQVPVGEGFEEFNVDFPSPTSTVVIENRRASGTKGGRVWINYISSGEGGTVFAERKLATTSDLDLLQSDIDYLSDSKQNNLVSGTNIKTINGESVLGAGDISTLSGTKLYLHTYSAGSASHGGPTTMSFISTDSEPYQYPSGVANLLLVCSVDGYKQYKDGFYCLANIGNTDSYTIYVRKIDMGHGASAFGYSEFSVTWTEETFSDTVTEL